MPEKTGQSLKSAKSAHSIPELFFRPPEDADESLHVISTISVYLDLWIARSGDWSLFQLISKSTDARVWKTIARCVTTASGLGLEGVSFIDLGLAGMVRAMQVFCEGLMSLNIPQLYLDHCPGISQEGIQSLIRDTHGMRKTQDLSGFEHSDDPKVLLEQVLAQVMHRSLS